jgi:hypothetical protein
MKTIIITFILALTVTASWAQDEVKTPVKTTPTNSTTPSNFDTFKNRIYVGGNVGAAFGTTTYINIQPLVGFKITPKFSMGAGVTYNYYSQNYYGTRYVSTVYGGNAFARYMILDNLFAQVGWDKLSVPDYYSGVSGARRWVDNILVGGGYRQSIGGKGSMVAAIYYNVNQTIYSPYANPIIQIGFNVGL